MTAKVVGNRGGQRPLQGKQVPMSSVNWVAVTGKAGDVAYVRSTSFNNYETKLCYAIQANAASVASVQLTLANEELACSKNANDQAMVPWDTAIPATTAITPLVDSTNKLPIGFAALKVTFTGTGVVYIFGR